jgi:hypothetical protein
VPDLRWTSWFTTDEPATDDCGIDEIDFAPDGTAVVYYILDDKPDTATWSLDGASLTLIFDEWPGGIAGTVAAGRIEAVDTWQSTKTNKVYHDVCIFEPG